MASVAVTCVEVVDIVLSQGCLQLPLKIEQTILKNLVCASFWIIRLPLFRLVCLVMGMCEQQCQGVCNQSQGGPKVQRGWAENM